MPSSPTNEDIQALREILTREGQEHALRHWPELNADQQQRLFSQLKDIDWAWIKRAWESDAVAHVGDVQPYPDVIRLGDRRTAEAIAVGEQALAQGRVATLLVAGGQGSRLGFDGPKGAFPLGQVSQRSLFAMHLQRLSALGRRYGVVPRLLIMTSSINHQATLDHLEAADYFGYPKERALVFQQGQVPAVDDQGKLLLTAPDALLWAPNGNGGLFAAMLDSGALDQLAADGVQWISYVQVDNPLALSCDPRFIGFAEQADADFACKAVAKTGPHEKVGNYALCDGRLGIVEYFEIADALAEATDAQGQLLFGFGNPGLFTWSVAFARAQAERTDLPIHRAHKKLAHIDAAGEAVSPSEPNGYKFELFALDTLTAAERPLVLECRREAEFAPVKNASGVDSADSARALMLAQVQRWAAEANVDMSDRVVEVSPLFALDAAEFAAKAEQVRAALAQPGPVYLGEP